MDPAAFAAWLEASQLGVAARGSVWFYPIASVAHVLGAALLLGSIIAFDLRVLGRGRDLPLAALGGLALPIARVGAAIAVPSGIVQFAADATHLLHNEAFLIKAGLLALALANVVAFHTLPAAAMRPTALASLLLWPSIVACGRLIAYL